MSYLGRHDKLLKFWRCRSRDWYRNPHTDACPLKPFVVRSYFLCTRWEDLIFFFRRQQASKRSEWNILSILKYFFIENTVIFRIFIIYSLEKNHTFSSLVWEYVIFHNMISALCFYRKHFFRWWKWLDFFFTHTIL